MRRYLVNATYCIYLSDIGQLYFDKSIYTIQDVVDEVKLERNIEINPSLVKSKKVNLQLKSNLLSNTDINLLQTAKAMDYILVTDDKGLIAIAYHNGVHPLDSPHFIHRLLIENKWTKEKAINTLNQLKSFYNRKYIIEKVIKDIQNWG